MTKQEEIIKGIRQLIDGCYNARNPDYPKLTAFQPMKFLNELIPYLHSQGVVIRVDRKLLPFPTGEDCLAWYSRVQKDMLRADCVAVIPLIEKES